MVSARIGLGTRVCSLRLRQVGMAKFLVLIAGIAMGMLALPSCGDRPAPVPRDPQASSAFSPTPTYPESAPPPEQADSTTAPGSLWRLDMRLQGMMSIYGAQDVEDWLTDQPGVIDARIYFFTSRAVVTYDAQLTSANALLSGINAKSYEWPYPFAYDPEIEPAQNAAIAALKSPSQELVQDIKSRVIPPEGKETSYGIPISYKGASFFIFYNDRTAGLSPSQQVTLTDGLNFVLVCCPPFPAWPG